jgi:hypothetical protein
MIKTWNFDFAGMMATYVGKNFAQGKKKNKKIATHHTKRNLVVSYQRKEILVISEQIIYT